MKILLDTNVLLDGITTRNTKDFQHSQLPVYTPDELLSVMNTLE